MKLAKNDAAVKTIFDHYKNLAVVALVFAASSKAFSEQNEKAFTHAMTQASAWALVVLGIFLFVLNERNGYYKMREANIPLWLHIPLTAVYALTLFTFTRILFQAHI